MYTPRLPDGHTHTLDTHTHPGHTTLEMAIEAGSSHPTGMHSCSKFGDSVACQKIMQAVNIEFLGVQVRFYTVRSRK